MKKHFIKYICSFMLLFIFIPIVGSIMQDYAIVTSATGTDNIGIVVRDGTFILELKNTEATSGYRWETAGWYVTLSPLDSTSTTVSDCEQEYVTLLYDDTYETEEGEIKRGCERSELGTSDGITTTRYVFQQEYVEDKFKDIDFTRLENNVTLYFHGIFNTYHYNAAEEKVYDTKNIYSWYEIRNYVFEGVGTWSKDSTRADFYKYFNNPVPYTPEKQPIKVVYVYDYLDENIPDETVTVKEVSKKVNKTFSYTGPNEITYNDTYFEYKKQKTKLLSLDSLEDITTVTGYLRTYYTISNQDENYTITAKVPFGGMEYVITYKESIIRENVTYTKECGEMVDNVFVQSAIMEEGEIGIGKQDDPIYWTGKVSSQYMWNGRRGSDTENETGENIYDLFGYYVSYIDGSEDAIYMLPDADMEDLLNGPEIIPEGGMTIHFLYQNTDNTKHPVSFVREWEDGEEFSGDNSSGTIGLYDAGETYTWSVKKNIAYINDAWVEKDIDPDDEYADLIRTYVTDAVGHIVEDSDDGANMYGDDVEVLALGITIHYVYEETVVVTPTPTPTITPPVVPEAKTISKEINVPTAVGEIKADNRGSEKFIAEQGVSTTESLYVDVEGTKYLLGYTFQKKVGTITYQVPVIKTYTLVWNNARTHEVEIEIYERTETVEIERAYGYWEITQLDYYTISSTSVSNYALPNGTVYISADDSYNPIPSMSYEHSTDLLQHVLKPDLIASGTLYIDGGSIYGGTTKPLYPTEDLTYEVNELVGEVRVKNDYLSFGGNIVMNNNILYYETGDINEAGIYQTNELCNENVLYNSDYIIDAEKLNGIYNSNGSITYRPYYPSINSKFSGNISYPVEGINSVKIHTPVICNPIVSADNDKYVQLITPTSNCTELVLDEDATLNDFTLTISNYGLHSSKQGYYTRDFSYNLYDGPTLTNRNQSYIQAQDSSGVLRNEVKFPIDVYMYQSDGSEKYIAKNTWIAIGRSTVRFHLPMWINEGVYTVDCRTIAVNCTDSLITMSEFFRNSSLNSYVATNTFKIEVSGRLYGMTIYDLTDYPLWEEVFRVKDSLQLKRNHTDDYTSGVNKESYSKNYIYDYTTGTKDQYGNTTSRLSKYTFPLVDGSHPYYKNVGVLKKGYAFRFSLESIGNLYSDACKVIIKPTFWYVDRNGKNRTQVDLYYEEDIAGSYRKLVKVGNSLDLVNVKQFKTGDVYLGIPKSELKATALLKNTTYKKLAAQIEAMFTFGNIKLNYAFRTFTNQDYTYGIQHSADAATISSKGITSNDIDIRKQRWYGEYYIPGTAMAVNSGYDVYGYANKYGVDNNSSFWKKDGYIIVNFDIYTIDQDGNQRLSYTNAENYLNNNNCCMWVMEGYQLEKTDYNDTTFTYKIGDIIMYDSDKNVNEDYTVGGTH